MEKTLKQQLAEKTLKDKWLPIREAFKTIWEAQLNGSCHFCKDAENDCEFCHLNSKQCHLNAKDNMYARFSDAQHNLESAINNCIRELYKIMNGEE